MSYMKMHCNPPTLSRYSKFFLSRVKRASVPNLRSLLQRWKTFEEMYKWNELAQKAAKGVMSHLIDWRVVISYAGKDWACTIRGSKDEEGSTLKSLARKVYLQDIANHLHNGVDLPPGVMLCSESKMLTDPTCEADKPVEAPIDVDKSLREQRDKLMRGVFS